MISYAYAGDSTTFRSNSWMHQMTDPNLVQAVNPGYANNGYTTADVLAVITPGVADCLVIMLGVNDVRLGVPMATSMSNIEKIVQKYAGASHIVLAFIMPNSTTDDGAPAHINRQQVGEIYNRGLMDLAALHGWLVGDPSNQFRHLDNSYKVPGYCESDNVHPTTLASGLIATRMATLIHTAVEGAQP